MRKRYFIVGMAHSIGFASVTVVTNGAYVNRKQLEEGNKNLGAIALTFINEVSEEDFNDFNS